MANIGIIYMATSIYKEYFYKFLNSFNKLFPEDNKTLIIISDGLQEYDNKQYDNFKIIVKNIVDLPYPIITACKLRYLTEFIKDYDFDYILYFDADTIILEKPIEFWDYLKSKLDTQKLIVSLHPHYLYTPDRDFGEPFIISNPESVGYTDKKYVNANRSYIITSFFAGVPSIIKYIDDKLYTMLGEDLSKFRWMPLYPDEAYLNSIYVKENIINNFNNIDVDRYITINPYIYCDTNRNTCNIYENNFPEINTIFINQKYNLAIKDNKKNNKV